MISSEHNISDEMTGSESGGQIHGSGNLAQSVSGSGSQIEDRAREGMQEARQKAAQMAGRSAGVLRRNPVPFLLGAFITGFFAGSRVAEQRRMALRRQMMQEARPASAGLLLTALVACGALLNRRFSNRQFRGESRVQPPVRRPESRLSQVGAL